MRRDEATGGLIIRFDSGLVHTGTLNVPYDTTMSWQDNSVWQKQLSGNFVLHFICHSHTDPGWKETFDQLYNDSVRDIYNAVIAGLVENPARRFSPEITVFMAKWWSDPLVTDLQRAQLRALVSNGQMEWVGGGWVQVRLQC